VHFSLNQAIEPKIKKVQIDEDNLSVELMDGRVVSVPLVWSWRLSEANSEQRHHYEIIGDGEVIHWPEIDEDISIEGMLYGIPAYRPEK
jgi:hypothetical protein